MISAKCFTKVWLDQCRADVGRIDPGLLEKSIYALDLVGRLAAAGLPFVFKGGTALLLLLDNFRRLSIDVDIACPLPRDEVAWLVAKVALEGPFLDVRPDQRDPARLPKRHHYALSFPSVVDPRVPTTLQLDVLEDEGHYPGIQQIPLRSRFIEMDETILIPVPTEEGLLADKLSAFAPATIGVPYKAFKASIKIAKHACDIGALFDRARNGRELTEAYAAVFAAENGYRGDIFTISEALEDTTETARLLSSINLKGYVPTPESTALLMGVAQVDTHMVGPRYTLDNARIAVARAAHLATCLRYDLVPDDLTELHFTTLSAERIGDVRLGEQLSILNRLKNLNPEAFYHWARIQHLR